MIKGKRRIIVEWFKSDNFLIMKVDTYQKRFHFFTIFETPCYDFKRSSYAWDLLQRSNNGNC